MLKYIVSGQKFAILITAILVTCVSFLICFKLHSIYPNLFGQQIVPTDDEYLIYRNGTEVFRYNPKLGSSTYVERIASFEGNLYEYTDSLDKGIEFPAMDLNPKNGDFTRQVFTAPNGNSVTFENSPSTYTITAKRAGLPDFVLTEWKRGTDLASFRYPVRWADPTHILVVKGNEMNEQGGVYMVDIESGEEKELVKANTYETFMISPSGRYIAVVSADKKNPSDNESNLVLVQSTHSIILYDLNTGQQTVVQNLGSIMGWTSNKDWPYVQI